MCRAEAHRRTLHEEWGRFFTDNPLKTGGDFDAQTGWHVERLKEVPEVPAPQLVIAGEMIHDLRSALDQLVWELVKRSGGKPSRHNSFPIYADPEAFFCEVIRPAKTKKRGPLGGLSPVHPAWHIIEEAQPDGRGEPDLQGLLGLRDLWNHDKHRMLFTGRVVPEEFDLTGAFVWRDGLEPIEERYELRVGEPLKDGAEVARLRFPVPGPDPEVVMKTQITAYVALGHDKGIFGREELANVCASAAYVIELCKPLLR